MNYSILGKSDLRVSQIGFGCMSIPANAEGETILQKAFDLGINYFDTADIYQHGANESLVGKVFKAKRDSVIIASKVGNVHRGDGRGLDWDPSKKHILKSIDQSLKRLQTDYLDLYQLHGGTINDNIDETIEAFELLKAQGKIRWYGISSIRPNVISEYISRSSIISVMMQYSLLDRRPEEECLDLLQKNNIAVLARGSVAQGLLIDKPAKPYLDHDSSTVKQAAKAIKNISGIKRNATQSAIQYTLHHPAVVSAVVGIRTLQQLIEAAATTGTPELSPAEIDLVRKSAPSNTYKDHRN